ncbi:MAG: ribosome assembly RNA-binding protein YhbY [Polyangiales bacterium]
MSENEPTEEETATAEAGLVDPKVDAPVDKAADNRRPRGDLSGKQRKHLRGLAHHLSALVRVGHEGLTDGLKDAVDEALATHELIKIKLLESAPIGKKEFAAEVADRCGAHVAGVVGRTIILYRRHPKKPQVRLVPR